MKSGIELIGKVLTRQVPSRTLLWALLNVGHRVLRTGNRRFEFERLYLEYPDPWAFHTRDYENQKYRHVLETVLHRRRGSHAALEIGCSIGVFTKMLAPHFDNVTGVDIAGEALRLASEYTRAANNIHYARGTLETLDLDAKFDVIFCAELLYYIALSHAPSVCRVLKEHLLPQGIIVTVSHAPSEKEETFTLSDWDNVLNTQFERVFKEVVQDPFRPYQIIIYAHRP